MNLKLELYKHLKDDKVKINWNKNPIRMDQFISFLTVELTRSRDHLGYENGWTLLENKDLKIGGGIVNGIEYLDRIQYGIKLSNPYNNYVSPFYLFDIMTDEGKAFFAEYYKDEISKFKESCGSQVLAAERTLAEAKQAFADTGNEILELESYYEFAKRMLQ